MSVPQHHAKAWAARRIRMILWTCIGACFVCFVLGEMHRLYLRKLALDELMQLIEIPNKGLVHATADAPWNVLARIGLDEQWYFSDCWVRVNAIEDDGAILNRMSDNAARVVTELEIIEAFYDRQSLLYINRMRSLKNLSMVVTSVPDRFIASLDATRLPLLRHVHLGGEYDETSDDGIAQSSIIPQLESLDLTGCKYVTDKSVPALCRGRKLEYLSIRWTRISGLGYRTIKAHLGPNVEVSW